MFMIITKNNSFLFDNEFMNSSNIDKVIVNLKDRFFVVKYKSSNKIYKYLDVSIDDLQYVKDFICFNELQYIRNELLSKNNFNYDDDSFDDYFNNNVLTVLNNINDNLKNNPLYNINCPSQFQSLNEVLSVLSTIEFLDKNISIGILTNKIIKQYPREIINEDGNIDMFLNFNVQM